MTNQMVLTLNSGKSYMGEAEKLMKDRSASTEGLSMEDSLDKMKAFHELGMREHCVSILDKLRKQLPLSSFINKVNDLCYLICCLVLTSHFNKNWTQHDTLGFCSQSLRLKCVYFIQNRHNISR